MRSTKTKLSTHIVARAAAGDQDASRKIVESLHRSVIATTHRFLGQRFRQQAEDIAQEAFLRLFRNLHRYDPKRASLEHWMLTIVKHLCFDVGKRRRLPMTPLDAESSDGDHMELPDPRTPEPSRMLLNLELREQVRAAVRGLQEKYRSALELRAFGEMGYAAIAALTNTNEATVKSRLFRARKALTRKLTPYLRASG